MPTLIVDKRGADDRLFLRALPGMALRIRHIVEKEIWSAPFFGSSSGLKIQPNRSSSWFPFARRSCQRKKIFHRFSSMEIGEVLAVQAIPELQALNRKVPQRPTIRERWWASALEICM